MQEFTEKLAPHHVAFDAYGVQVRISTNTDELLERIELMVPASWQRRPRAEAQYRLALLQEDADVYSIYNNEGICIHDATGREYALMSLDNQVSGYVANEATDYVFVHAGVVADRDRAIVLPGLSFSGKTTLVRALVEAGATYYSDEFAVLDERGLVHPYTKPLSIRKFQTPTVDTHVSELGGTAGELPLAVGMVITTRYRSGAYWDPEELSTGAGALNVLEHAIPARARPEQTLRVLKAALSGAVILRGDRGEAEEFAEILLDTFRAAA